MRVGAASADGLGGGVRLGSKTRGHGRVAWCTRRSAVARREQHLQCNPNHLARLPGIQEPSDIAVALAGALQRAVGSSRPVHPRLVGSELWLAKPPPMELDLYLPRLFQYFGCSPGCFVVASVLVSRLEGRLGGAVVCSNTAHLVVLAALVVASKLVDDFPIRCQWAAVVGGVTPPELTRVELALLRLLDFAVHVSPAEYTDALCLMTGRTDCNRALLC